MLDVENFDFSIKTKQSPVAIILLIWKYFINIIRQFWPALIALFIGRRSGSISDLVLLAIIVVAVSSLFFAIAFYLRFSFKIIHDELLIEKGVFKKTKLNIPIERIQTLNFEQGIIHQVFNVVKIDVDTAGSAKNEFTFNALEKDKAEALRNLVLERKSILSNEDPNSLLDEVVEKETYPVQKVFSLNLKELFIIGLTQNHLRTLVLLFFFCLWGFGELQDAGLNVDFINKENAELILNSGILIIFGLTIFLLMFIIIGTAIRTILKFYDYKMFRVASGFKIQSGLFNRRENAVLDYKIQQINWVNNPLKRLFKIHQLQLKQASSIEVSSKKSIKIPGISIDKINEVLNFVLGQQADYNEFVQHKIEKAYLVRMIMYYSIFPWIAISIGLWYFTEEAYFYFILFMIPYMIISSIVSFKKWTFGFNNRILYTHNGVFENKNNIIQLHKIQNIKIKQSPYQWKRNLASLRIYTAAGSIEIPYLKYEHAIKINDFLLYKVELNSEKWY